MAFSKRDYLKAVSISADIFVQGWDESKKVDSKTGKAMASVHQRFSIKFVKTSDSSVIV